MTNHFVAPGAPLPMQTPSDPDDWRFIGPTALTMVFSFVSGSYWGYDRVQTATGVYTRSSSAPDPGLPYVTPLTSEPRCSPIKLGDIDLPPIKGLLVIISESGKGKTRVIRSLQKKERLPLTVLGEPEEGSYPYSEAATASCFLACARMAHDTGLPTLLDSLRFVFDQAAGSTGAGGLPRGALTTLSVMNDFCMALGVTVIVTVNAQAGKHAAEWVDYVKGCVAGVVFDLSSEANYVRGRIQLRGYANRKSVAFSQEV